MILHSLLSTFKIRSENMFHLKREDNSYAIISFDEEIRLTGKKSVELKEWFKEQKIDNLKTIILDCQNVIFIDSMGIASIISLYKSITSLEKRMILSGLRKEVKEILTLLKLDKLFLMDDRNPEQIIKDL
ncbi:MAG: STAS domain-containing protein [Kosmotoga sp.]|nr:MAG: STAS domain-containing protein [Kosmotoga sp.]